jgi:hypothetical protein
MISMTVEHPKRCDGKPREELFVEDRLHYSPPVIKFEYE